MKGLAYWVEGEGLVVLLLVGLVVGGILGLVTADWAVVPR